MTKICLWQKDLASLKDMPITSAVRAHIALKKMLQDFLNQFQVASFMFAKFDLAALQNSLILQQIFLQCVSTNLHVYFTIVGHKLKAMTSGKKALPIQFSIACQKINKCQTLLNNSVVYKAQTWTHFVV